MTDQVEGQMSLSDLGFSFLKTCRDYSVLDSPKEQTSKQSSRKSSESSNQKSLLCLCLTRGSGTSPAYSWVTDSASLGEYSTANIGEQPSTMMREMSYNEVHRNGVNASHLSQILAETAHPKYYLSSKAAAGILRRAAKRGKALPEILKQALENRMNRGNCCNT